MARAAAREASSVEVGHGARDGSEEVRGSSAHARVGAW